MQFKRSRFVAIIATGIIIGIVSQLSEADLLSNGQSTPASPSQLGLQNFILAVSWQPAFCETRPRRPECRSQRPQRTDAKQFSLHGLWPDPRDQIYCGVTQSLKGQDKAGRWRNLPKLELSADTRENLNAAMPGTQSFLHRHEWIKHGTCIPQATPETYFQASLTILEALNRSTLATLFVVNRGNQVQIADAQAALIDSFGTGARGKIAFDCVRDGERRLVQEVLLSLSGNLRDAKDLSAMLKGAPEIRRGCLGGIVDRVGLQ